jgi:hypothetical protein
MNARIRIKIAALLTSFAAAGASLVARASEPASGDDFVAVTGCRLAFVNAVELASERQGILADIAAPGSAIAAGRDVARLRDSVLKASLAIAERESANDIEVRFAAKAAELAQLKHERAMQANRQNPDTVSDLELKELLLAADRAVLQLEQAEHRLAIARLRLDEIRATVQSLHIVAPFAARVRAAYKQPGEVVQQGEVVAEVVNTERVRVEGDVDFRELAWVRPQAAAHVRLDDDAVPADLASRTFTGVVTFVDVKVEPVSHRVRFAAELDNRSGLLREGLAATVLIPKARTPDNQTPVTQAAAITAR